MRMHFLQHVKFEDYGLIGDWAKKNKHTITVTEFFKSGQLPETDDYDILFVMGGPMGVYDDDKFKWLAEEKKFIEKSIKENKIVIGICLGAQLIANVLGAKVYKNKHKEIGWYNIEKTTNNNSGIAGLFPQKIKVFHWHGDTYDIPNGALHIAKSQACENQAFLFNDNVLGLQFHLELKLANIKNLIKNCKDEIIDNIYIQKEKEMIKESKNNLKDANNMMINILDYYTKKLI